MIIPVLFVTIRELFIKMLNYILIYHAFCDIINIIIINRVFYLQSLIGCVELFWKTPVFLVLRICLQCIRIPRARGFICPGTAE